jgi:hypothetical protein
MRKIYRFSLSLSIVEIRPAAARAAELDWDSPSVKQSATELAEAFRLRTMLTAEQLSR